MKDAPAYLSPRRDDLDVLAKTILGEARGESLQGQAQVAGTILRRAAIAARHVAAFARPHVLFGDGTIAAACQAPWQFSCWNRNNPNRTRIEAATLDDPKFQIAMHVACGAVNGLIAITYPDATHYYNPKAVAHTPAWVSGLPARDGKPSIPPALFLGSVGNHRFYVEPAAPVNAPSREVKPRMTMSA